ncbi:helix-turn-helix domain-containing protein [uncultured Secundilactobacillus sp.]|uniref:helix-turn-helix domain-containing protein n=1 Tax=uncultured Secundilactobacillus sp. TaxID=2813935 RepID=UPI0025830806|nr:helix-turn-helix transcriptional regulator [uncultured Secundilactobacillus sp.]
MTISEKLKECRAATNYTQADVAEKLHLSRKTISGWETGRNYPDIGSLVELSDIYGVSLDDLMRDDRMLQHFDEERKSRARDEIVLRVSYWLNIGLLILGYVDLMRPNGFHSALIPLGLFANLLVFFSHFAYWEKFKNIYYSLRALFTFIAVFMFTAVLSVLNKETLGVLSQNDAPSSSGVIAARVLLTLLITASAVTAIFFWNKKKR